MYTSQTRSTCLVVRETDIRKCFKHENQKYPPALSSSVKLKRGVRSSWIPRDSWRFSCHENTLHVDVTVLDGVVHISPNGESKTFAEYEKVVFIPRVFLELGKPNAWISSGMYT